MQFTTRAEASSLHPQCFPTFRPSRRRTARLLGFALLAFFLSSTQPPAQSHSVSPAPTIVCPAELKHPAPAGETGTTVHYPAPIVAPADASVTCTPSSGSFFPAGTTEVKCTARNELGSDSCAFSVTVIPRPLLVCSDDFSVFTGNPAGALVNYPTPLATGPDVAIACAPASGSLFPVGVTAVTCTAANVAGSDSCSFAVTVAPQPQCNTICLRAAHYWLLNLPRLPRGAVQIWGVNGNLPVSTNNSAPLRLALLGNVTGIGALTPLQQFNRQYVTAQLNLLAAGGGGSPAVYNALGSNLSCSGLSFTPVRLGNGATLTPDSMLQELFTQASLAVQQNRLADMEALAALFHSLNGDSPLGLCRTIPQL